MIQKQIGRPRAFDIDEALLAAVIVFWKKGYDGASMKDLKDAMGINAPSLYAVFGDKHSLFLKAIKRYVTNDACAPLVAFESEGDIKKAVKAFMEAAIDYATQLENAPLGCFMSSCVSTSAGSVEGTQELLKQSIVSTDERLAERFKTEITKGNLPEGFPALERARLMFDLRQGHVIRARAGLPKKTMTHDLNYRVKMVLGIESE